MSLKKNDGKVILGIVILIFYRLTQTSERYCINPEPLD